MTRAQAAHILANILGLKREGISGSSFSDVSSSHWAFASIEAAVKAGYLKGYPDGSFRPEQPISRSEGIVLALRLSREPLPAVELPQLTDVSSDYWAAKEIAAALDAGLIGLKAEKQFAPGEALTRGGIARAFAVMLVLAPGYREVELEGVLTALTGGVKVKKAGESSYRVIEKSEKVKGGDLIQTGANSSARITFDDGTDIKLEQNTQINLTKNAGLRYIKKDGQPGVMVDLLGVELKVGELFGALATQTTEEMNETAVITPTTQVRSYAREELVATNGTASGISLRGTGTKVNLAAAQKELPWWKKPKQKRVRIEIEMAWGVCGVRGTFVHAFAEPTGRSGVDALTGSVVVRSEGKESVVQAGEKAVIAQRGEVTTAKMEATDYKNWAKPEVQTWAIETAKNMDANAPAPVVRGTVVEEVTKPTVVKPEEKPLEEKPQETKPVLPPAVTTIVETVQSALQQASSQAAAAPTTTTTTITTTTTSGGGGGGGGGGGTVTVLPPSANPPSGEYSTPITVTLTQPQGAQIKYTLDGSDPRYSEKAVVYDYNRPVLLDQNGSITMRAVAVQAGRFSEVATFTYTLTFNLLDYTRITKLEDTLRRFAALNDYQFDFTLSLLQRLNWFGVLSNEQKASLAASGLDEEGFEAIVNAICSQFYTDGPCGEKSFDEEKAAVFRSAVNSEPMDYLYLLNFAAGVKGSVPEAFRASLSASGMTANQILGVFIEVIAQPLDLLTIDNNLMVAVNEILSEEGIDEAQKEILRSWGINWDNFEQLVPQLSLLDRESLRDVLQVLRRPPGGTSGTIIGTVYGPNNQPLPRISVECHRVFHEEIDGNSSPGGFSSGGASSWLVTYATAVTDSNGQFTFTGLPWGEYEIVAPADDRFGPNDDNYVSVNKAVYLYDNAPTSIVNLQLQKGGSISGRVHDAKNVQQGVANAWVYLYGVADESGWVTVYPVPSGSNGEYIFRGVKAGNYKVVARLPYESGYYEGWHGGDSYDEAEVITLGDKEERAGIDIALIMPY